MQLNESDMIYHMEERYFTYKKYLINKFGEKVYKLPIQIPVTCPNKTLENGYTGCAFCSALGTGFESLENTQNITKQLEFARSKVTSRYQAKKFIGYFQNYTNTNLPVETLMHYLDEVAAFGVVGIDLATRPDCVSNTYLNALKEYTLRNNIELTIEIGLQIADDILLDAMNRGHDVATFIDCIRRIRSFGFSTCVHIILNLPDSKMEHVKKTIALINELECDVVKFHSLYIPTDCSLSIPYQEGKVNICSYEAYLDRIIYAIRHLKPNIAISRLVSRIPEENSLFSNWNMSWWKIYNDIIQLLETQNIYQGMDYQNN